MQSFSKTWIKNASKRFPMFLKNLILSLNQLLILGCSSFEFWSIYAVAKPLFQIWPLGFVFQLNVKFNYLCRASNTMAIRAKVSAWTHNQRLYFISFQNTCVKTFYLSSTSAYLGSGSEGHVFKSECLTGQLRLSARNNHWNCTDLNKKLLKTDYQSSSFNMAVENEL